MATAVLNKLKLSFHKPSGNYCKTVKGKRYYLGKDHDEALETWCKFRADFEVGIDPRKNDRGKKTKRLSLRDGCNLFLDRRKPDVAAATWNSLKYECQTLVEFFGPETQISSLGPEHFERLRQHLMTESPVSLGNKIGRVKAILNWLSEREYIEPPKYGIDFKRPGKKQVRKHRRLQDERTLSPDEFIAVTNALGLQMRAAVFLGLNCGFGPTDCFELPKDVVDFEGKVIHWARVKTEADRSCPLWPETIEALKTWEKFRPEARAKRFFGFRNANTVSCQFHDGLKRAAKTRTGATFYSCRHTLATVGRAANDDAALRLIMGHVDDSILDEHYTHRFPRERLDAVANHVRHWLFEERKPL